MRFTCDDLRDLLNLTIEKDPIFGDCDVEAILIVLPDFLDGSQGGYTGNDWHSVRVRELTMRAIESLTRLQNKEQSPERMKEIAERSP
ncbi:hypothetical protein EHM76_04345 [bacterium]|nr:MAG: hypothetical protein EHM76_04345 [bacterium]